MNQHCVCRSSCRVMKKIIAIIIWLHERKAEIMIRKLFSLFRINIIRIFCQLSSIIIIMILWSSLIYLMFVLKIIYRSVWIWLFNIFCSIMIAKLDWTLDLWFWKELITENRCFSIRNKKSVLDIIIKLLEKELSNLIKKSEHVIINIFELWALFLINDVIIIIEYDLITAASSVNSESLVCWLKVWILIMIKFNSWAEFSRELIDDASTENNVSLILTSLKQESDWSSLKSLCHSWDIC